MARTLAHCYWSAGLDANDAEFVVAPAPPTPTPSPTNSPQPPTPVFYIENQPLVLWMLDFDCVRDMSQDGEGIQQAVEAFYQNDAYCPRPHFHGHTRDDVGLWGEFRDCFCEAARGEGEREKELAEMWIRGVEENGEKRARQEVCWCVEVVEEDIEAGNSAS
jgi:hypothetical protein